ncbi:unnamed protein product [Cylindrotheca closterium]|uniref:FAS1 domain-containing protein n=1 Tax=Cylindrotheca closterium TaxID=2856 RepID=A0AAD2CSX2_9STRA|nr:unnamed protein product [Cylindrotheca closterium]
MKLLIPLFLFSNIALVAADLGRTEPPRPTPRPTEHDKFNRDGTEAPDFIVVPTDAPVWPPTPPPVRNPPPTRPPTPRPSPRPSPRPTPFPTLRPTPSPTNRPTPSPTNRPTPQPTPRPTERPVTPDRDDEPGEPIVFPPPTPNPTPAPTPQPTTARPTLPQNIFEIAEGNSCPHETLLNVIDTTPGVKTFLISSFPVTIFGPTNSAFASAGDVDDATLGNLLAGHVVPGVLTTADIIANECVEVMSLAGEQLRIRYANAQIEINDAVVTCDDAIGPGGNILGVDRVILPGTFRPCRNGYVEQAFQFGIPDPETMPFGSMYDAAWRRGGYGLLLSSITRSTGVMDAIARHYPVTIFAPNDEAFNAMFDMLVMTDMRDIGSIFSAHVVKGIYTLRDFAEAGCMELDTVGGTKIRVLVENLMVKVNDGLLTTPDMVGNGADGIIQGIDTFLLEGSFTPCPGSSGNTMAGSAIIDPPAQRDDTSAIPPPLVFDPPAPEETETVVPPTAEENEEDEDDDKDKKSKSKKSKKDSDDRRLRGGYD